MGFIGFDDVLSGFTGVPEVLGSWGTPAVLPGPAVPGGGPGALAAALTALPRTGHLAERLWLLGGLGLGLTAAGIVAAAALRGRRPD
jgi:hypothetical protein